MNTPILPNLADSFNFCAEKPVPKPKPSKTTVPLSIRVTVEEKAALEAMAGTLALSAYIRERLLGNELAERPKRYQKKPRSADMDMQEIARLLGMFGQSELARGMLALSLAAKAGELEVTPDVVGRIESACSDIQHIRTSLVMALGVKSQELR